MVVFSDDGLIRNELAEGVLIGQQCEFLEAFALFRIRIVASCQLGIGLRFLALLGDQFLRAGLRWAKMGSFKAACVYN